MTTELEDRFFPTLDLFESHLDRLIVEGASDARARRLRVGVLAAGGAAVAGLGVALLVAPAGEQPLGVSPAEAALHSLADEVAEDGSDLTLARGEFLYRREFGSGGAIVEQQDGTGYLIDPETYNERILQRWENRDGDGWTQAHGGSVGAEGVHQTSYGLAGIFAGSGPLTYEQMLALPRDPAALYERVEELTGDEADATGVIAALQQLLERPLPVDLQAALLDAAALSPDTHLTGEIQPPVGGPVTAISYDRGHGVSWELLVDPQSGEYRGRAIVLSGERYYDSLILSRGVVGEVGALPAGG